MGFSNFIEYAHVVAFPRKGEDLFLENEAREFFNFMRWRMGCSLRIVCHLLASHINLPFLLPFFENEQKGGSHLNG
jgi:hypothetical protein